MTPSDHSDFVRIMKGNAIARFNRLRKAATLLQVAEVMVFLAALSWSSTRLPEVFRLLFDYLLNFCVRFFNHHLFVFFVGNAIIASLLLLSRRSAMPAGAAESQDDFRASGDGGATVATAQEPEARENSDVGGLVLPRENWAGGNQCDALATAIEEATRQIRRFQRTQSEKLKREIAVRSERELSRSETQIGRMVVASASEANGERREATSYEEVERLSNEEFRLAIDAFIEKHQKFFHEQKLAEQKQNRLLS